MVKDKLLKKLVMTVRQQGIYVLQSLASELVSSLVYPSSEGASSAGMQEFTNILQKSDVHYHVHKIPTLVSILSQISPVHIDTKVAILTVFSVGCPHA
jgi:hypothetical protein